VGDGRLVTSVGFMLSEDGASLLAEPFKALLDHIAVFYRLYNSTNARFIRS
jgi:hypothetical protein